MIWALIAEHAYSQQYEGMYMYIQGLYYHSTIVAVVTWCVRMVGHGGHYYYSWIHTLMAHA